MKLTLLLFFTLLSSSVFAQYGRLEPLREGDTSQMVMRTPKETLNKLSTSPDKKLKRIASLITAVEKQLEFSRGGYIVNRLPAINVQVFTKTIKALEQNGVRIDNYLQEYFIYYPRR